MFQIVFKIEKLDIAESYFKGKVRLEKDEFTINTVSYTHLRAHET